MITAPTTGPGQGGPPADRGPDDKFRRQQEADRLRRDNALVRGVERAGKTGEGGADRKGHRLEAHWC